MPNLLTGDVLDLEKEYKESLAGRMVTVMDVAADDSVYLVLGKNKEGGHFLWMIEKGDTKCFLPVIKKNGILMPASLSPIEEFQWMMEHHQTVTENFTMDDLNQTK